LSIPLSPTPSLHDALPILPDLGRPEDLGKISGFGWALGYVGGMASAVFVLLVLGEVSAENFARIRWVGPWAAAFFLVAAIPTFVDRKSTRLNSSHVEISYV